MTAPSSTSSLLTTPPSQEAQPRAEKPERGRALPRVLDWISGMVDSLPRSIFIAISCAVGIGIIAQAWIAEDAFITYRSLDNFVHGLGLRWSPDERVQTYTHPLWAVLHFPFYALTKSWPVSSFLLSVGCIAGAAWSARSVGARTWVKFALLLAVPFAISPALRIYSISGLENPMTEWLLAAATALLLGEYAFRTEAPPWKALALVTAIAGLTRLDTLLLFVPIWSVLLIRYPGKKAGVALCFLGLVILAWEAFSLFYYGLPFPNTKYAKMNTGVPTSELLLRGFYHLRELFYREPQTLLFGGSGIAMAFIGLWQRRTVSHSPTRQRDERAAALAAGALLYAGYVTFVGGGFMQGRLFAAPLWLGLLLAIHAFRDSPTRRWILLPLSALALTAYSSGVMSFSPGYTAYQGVIDEQDVFAETNMVWPQWLGQPGRSFADHRFSQKGILLRESNELNSDAIPSEAIEFGAAGMFGFFAGPEMIGIDTFALCDLLLARLPLAPEKLASGNWRTGHFLREIPRGYSLARVTGDTNLMDSDLAEYYKVLRSITRGPLLSTERLRLVLRFNMGEFEHLRESYLEREYRQTAATP